ncbi:hypothetical protein SHKM778_59100 [Streptomyces sp. KM77-8]|uniref:Uncharacterized protein n=1 Tax=Streptomyces haneummycinicus TaxID=3074435 RepID=A0AAT9HQ99_9ACTN
MAWLALNAEPADAVLALTVNFSAWGGYCATIAEALRARYGFDDDACAFFDFFAEPAPELDEAATKAVRTALAEGRLDENRARRQARLLQAYEAAFWTALAETPRGARLLRYAAPPRERDRPAPAVLRGTPTAVGDTGDVDPIGELREFDGQRGDRVLIQPFLARLHQPDPPPAHRTQQLADIGGGNLQGPAVVDDQRQSHFAVHSRDRSRADITHPAKPW